MDEPFALCQICRGPIWAGGPAIQHGTGWAHYFKTTCQQELEDRRAAEEKATTVQ